MLEVARTVENFAFNTRGVLKLLRFSRAAPPWGGGGGKGKVFPPPPQFHFPEDTIKEFIIVLQN